jgi:hypothetical protein
MENRERIRREYMLARRDLGMRGGMYPSVLLRAASLHLRVVQSAEPGAQRAEPVATEVGEFVGLRTRTGATTVEYLILGFIGAGIVLSTLALISIIGIFVGGM